MSIQYSKSLNRVDEVYALSEGRYMVFMETGSAPRKIHHTYLSAFKEANRIAERHPGSVVRVLSIACELVGKIQVVEVPTESGDQKYSPISQRPADWWVPK